MGLSMEFNGKLICALQTIVIPIDELLNYVHSHWFMIFVMWISIGS